VKEFHVSYLMNYPWQDDPEVGPDCLVSVRFVAASEEAARALAKTKIREVITVYTDAEDEATEDGMEITVRAWDAWGAKLDKNWKDICNITIKEDDE